MVKEILTIVHSNIDSVNLDVKNVTRMGENKRPGYTRPIQVKFLENGSKGKVFRNSGKLKGHDKHNKIHISNDKTTKEIQADRKLKADLDAQRVIRLNDDPIIYRCEIIPRAHRSAKAAAATAKAQQGHNNKAWPINVAVKT